MLWQQVLSIHLASLMTEPNQENLKRIHKELMRMAVIADRYNETMAQLKEMEIDTSNISKPENG